MTVTGQCSPSVLTAEGRNRSALDPCPLLEVRNKFQPRNRITDRTKALSPRYSLKIRIPRCQWPSTIWTRQHSPISDPAQLYGRLSVARQAALSRRPIIQSIEAKCGKSPIFNCRNCNGQKIQIGMGFRTSRFEHAPDFRLHEHTTGPVGQ